MVDMSGLEGGSGWIAAECRLCSACECLLMEFVDTDCHGCRLTKLLKWNIFFATFSHFLWEVFFQDFCFENKYHLCKLVVCLSGEFHENFIFDALFF